MHSYSIDTNERIYGVFCVSVISLLISLVFYGFFLLIDFSIPSFIDGPSILMIFGLVYLIFENSAWKWKFFRGIKLIKTPNLNGKWLGEYHSFQMCDEDILGKKGETSLTIEQTWTKIRIVADHGTSSSYSEMVGIAINDNGGITIKFQYINEAKNNTVRTMNSHIGFNKLRFHSEENLIEGNYFTDRSRKTYGTLKYKRVL